MRLMNFAWSWLGLGTALCAFAPRAMSFPETVRHKYNNCGVCHVSPTGGGLVTDYGRALSLEVLSTSGGEDEAMPLYNKVKLPSWFRLGGDFRTIQTYRDTPAVKEGRFFLMQADLEVGIATEKVSVVGTIGREDVRTGNTTSKGEMVSHRHYVLLQPVDYYNIRVGRFRQAFGINTPEHALSTKRGLGWDEDTDTYNVELSRIAEETNVFVTAILGRFDKKDEDTDKGVSASASIFLASRHKLGLSYFQGMRTETEASRRIVGPWLISGITEKAFVMLETDYVQTYANKTLSGTPTNGVVGYGKQGYEVVKGLNLYITQDISKRDLDKDDMDFEAYGPGVQWMPRPHLEVNGAAQKQRTPAVSGKKWTDFAYMMFHYYL